MKVVQNVVKPDIYWIREDNNKINMESLKTNNSRLVNICFCFLDSNMFGQDTIIKVI